MSSVSIGSLSPSPNIQRHLRNNWKTFRITAQASAGSDSWTKNADEPLTTWFCIFTRAACFRHCHGSIPSTISHQFPEEALTFFLGGSEGHLTRGKRHLQGSSTHVASSPDTKKATAGSGQFTNTWSGMESGPLWAATPEQLMTCFLKLPLKDKTKQVVFGILPVRKYFQSSLAQQPHAVIDSPQSRVGQSPGVQSRISWRKKVQCSRPK